MMLSGFFTCLFDFWVLFCWSFFKCKIALATLRKRWAIHTCLSWTFPAPNSQDILSNHLVSDSQRLSMIYLWYSSTFSFNGTQVIMKSTQKTEKLNHFQLVNAKDGARHTRHTWHRHTRHPHTGHPWEASEGSSSCARRPEGVTNRLTSNHFQRLNFK